MCFAHALAIFFFCVACFNQYVVHIYIDNSYLWFFYTFVYRKVFSGNIYHHDYYLKASVQWEGPLEDEGREAYSFIH